MGFINAFKGAYKGFLNNRHETKVLPRARRSSYKAAAYDRLNYSWKVNGSSADRAIQSDNKTVRNKARDMIRNNVYVKQAMRSLMLNVCGTGTKPQLQIKRTNGKQNDKLNVSIEKAWSKWTRYDSYSANGIDCLASIERKIINTLFSDGVVIDSFCSAA